MSTKEEREQEGMMSLSWTGRDAAVLLKMSAGSGSILAQTSKLMAHRLVGSG